MARRTLKSASDSSSQSVREYSLKAPSKNSRQAVARKTSKPKAPRRPSAARKRSASSAKTTLVIVESPAKAATIEHYLGAPYKVMASKGHLVDLPKSRMAIDIAHNFEPEYITVRGRAGLLKELQKEAKASSAVLLASDNDREGEAIAWHLKRALEKTTPAPISRIVFNEITPNAIREAVKKPGDIDEAKVNAQKARRVLDRLVGYKLSPFLWKKVKGGLSAGRVQSVALRMICEREQEVENFIPEEYWSLAAEFSRARKTIKSELVLYKGERPELKSSKDVDAIIDTIKDKPFVVSDIRETEKTVRPRPPFTTSTLQQTAANRLGFVSRKTMQLAQGLYEGVQIGSSRVGLITYMRTDSVRVSRTALDAVRAWIGENFPDDLPPKSIEYSVGKGAQDAHEAIRPTYVTYTPESVKKYLSNDQLKLYSIIWERFVSSQMKAAVSKTTSVDITAGDALFRASAGVLAFKGFYDVIKVLASKEEIRRSLPPLKKGEVLPKPVLSSEQHFTQGPARYTDATIVRALEEKGIGRPSTYAPIISVLLDRYYVSRDNRQLVPTALGKVISKILVESFPDVINEEFTSEVETNLDKIEQNTLVWNDMIAAFYGPFEAEVKCAMESADNVKASLDESTNEVCELCGRPMVKRLGRFGYFLACSGFPECRNTKSIPLAKCPKPGCGGDIVERKTKKGRTFYGCTNYPKCDFITNFKPLNVYCPKCGWFLVEKYDKKNGSYKSCINPDCDFLHSPGDGEAEKTASEGLPETSLKTVKK